MSDDLKRFLRFVRIDLETGCHVWEGAKQSRGYGCFGVGGGKSALAHRWIYEQAVGPIGPGLQIDHACKNKACVNPAHLEAVSAKENNRRSDSPSAKNARATHCANGHELSGPNLFFKRDGRRQCRRCHNTMNREADRERYWRRKAEALEAKLVEVAP